MSVPRHEAVLAALRATLDARTGEAWQDAGKVLHGLLDDYERGCLYAVLAMQAGRPTAPLRDEDVAAEARLWAAGATDAEQRTYAKALVEAMEPGMRRRFLSWAATAEAGDQGQPGEEDQAEQKVGDRAA